MKKRICAVVIALLFVLALVPFNRISSAQADSFDLGSVYEPYFILVNADEPTVAYKGIEKEADKQVYPASTTKILTCIVALEKGNLDDMVTVSENAVDFSRGNSLMGLEAGDEFSMRDLLYGMMLPSGNDAAIAIAEHISGSTEAFADLMNQKAQELGMTHSHFVTVHGKQNDNHYTTVRDMALLTAYALKNDSFREIVGAKTYLAESGPRAISLVNSNRLLVDTPASEDLPNPISCLYEYAIGVKTGDTNAAGKCLIAAAEREGITLIAVLYGGTLNDPEYNDGWTQARKDRFNVRRFEDAISMFNYAYGEMTQTLTVAELKNLGLPVEFTVDISNAQTDDPQGGKLVAKADLSDEQTITLMQPVLDSMRADMNSVAKTNFTNIYAPIGEGAVIGSVTYSYNDKILLSANLIATRSVKEGNAQIDVATQTAQADIGSLIGEPNATVLEGDPDSTGGCASVPKNMKWVLIVLPIIFVLLIICVTMFIVYLNAEAKRRKRAAARRRAARQARENGYRSDR